MRDFLDNYLYVTIYIFAIVFIALLPTILEHVRPEEHAVEANNTITGKHLTFQELGSVEQLVATDGEDDTSDVLTTTFTPAAPVVTSATKVSTATGSSAYVASAASYSEAVSYSPSITINGRVLSITDVNNTLIDSGTHVNRIGHLLYGHNYANVFGDIAGAGSFTVSEGGNATTYYVRNVVTLTKEETARFMNALVNGAYMGGRYQYILMTCAGQLYGGGDASHRTIVFAS